MEQPLQNPIEDQRKAALEHYQEASRYMNHWSSFVENAIKAYNPEVATVKLTPAEKEEKPDCTKYAKVNCTSECGNGFCQWEKYDCKKNLHQEITTLRASEAYLLNQVAEKNAYIIELETAKSGQKQG